MPRAKPSRAGARLVLLAALAALAGGCASTADFFKDAGRPAAAAPLESWPHRELWTGIVFNGQKVGFTRREVRPAADAPGRYEIESEAAPCEASSASRSESRTTSQPLVTTMVGLRNSASTSRQPRVSRSFASAGW